MNHSQAIESLQLSLEGYQQHQALLQQCKDDKQIIQEREECRSYAVDSVVALLRVLEAKGCSVEEFVESLNY